MVLARKKVVESDFKTFKTLLQKEKRTYSSLVSLKNFLTKQEEDVLVLKKIGYTQKKMKEVIKENNGLVTKKRVPGTGKKNVIEIPYKDTEQNRVLGRVGKTWSKVVYEGAEYKEHVQTTSRRYRTKRKKTDENGNVIKRSNPWITAVMEARKELNPDRFIPLRKDEPNPAEEDEVLGHQLYLRARSIQARNKEAKEADKENDAPPPTRKKAKV